MKRRRRALNERGQSLVLVTLLLFVLVAMLALILDGGFAYYERRRAQNAADAGALAGATVLCKTGSVPDAIAKAREYAETRNQTVAGSITAGNGLVSVTTTITYNTFFAAILGRPEMTVSGEAEAGCFAPGYGTGVLPIAWSCRPPVAGSDSADCEIEYGTKPCKWGEDPIYLIMDSEDTAMDVYCKDPGLPPEQQVGSFDCDLNNDGVNEIEMLSGGNRSWLDLDGSGTMVLQDGSTVSTTCPKDGGGASELKDWIENGLGCQLSVHTWVPGNSGNVSVGYANVDKYHVKPYPYPSDHEVLIPVYDALCRGDPRTTTDCWSGEPSYIDNWFHPPDSLVNKEAASQVYYHVISFARFQPTCVWDGGGGSSSDNSNFKKSGCDARDWAADPMTPGGPNIGDSVKTIEGCFIEGYVDSVGGKPSTGVDAGAYNIFLSK